MDQQGRVWFVGQQGNYLAFLDPETGEFKRYDLDPGAGPHNLIVDAKTDPRADPRMVAALAPFELDVAPSERGGRNVAANSAMNWGREQEKTPWRVSAPAL